MLQDDEQKSYRKLVLENGRIIGAILLGDVRGSQEILAAIDAHTDVSSLKADLQQAGFDFSRLA